MYIIYIYIYILKSHTPVSSGIFNHQSGFTTSFPLKKEMDAHTTGVYYSFIFNCQQTSYHMHSQKHMGPTCSILPSSKGLDTHSQIFLPDQQDIVLVQS